MKGVGWCCPLGVLALGHFRRWKPRSATSCILPGVIWPELQNDLQISATCALLGEEAKRGQAANQGLLPLVLGLGPLRERSRACQGQMLLI